MQAQRVQTPQERGRSFALVFEIGDEVNATLRKFAKENDIHTAHFHAIGAFRHVTLAYWNWETKEYESREIDQQVECASLTGNIALAPEGDDIKVHMHAVLGMPDGNAKAGHVQKAHVRPTLELFLTEGTTTLQRQKDDPTGLALLRPRS